MSGRASTAYWPASAPLAIAAVTVLRDLLANGMIGYSGVAVGGVQVGVLPIASASTEEPIGSICSCAWRARATPARWRMDRERSARSSRRSTSTAC